ncbi:MAG: hypothetical protein KKD33_01395, partial [Verrucomicrobia bacterium]|nr:hypothetical protein [Verrucomicrobiota bacterium]
GQRVAGNRRATGQHIGCIADTHFFIRSWFLVPGSSFPLYHVAPRSTRLGEALWRSLALNVLSVLCRPTFAQGATVGRPSSVACPP